MAKPGPQCSVCKHREHAAIDLALSRGVSVSALARRYGISDDILYRHRKLHIPPQLKAKLITGPAIEVDLEKLREVEGQSLLAHLVGLRNRLLAALDSAEENNDGHLFIGVTAQLHRNMELVGKLLGELNVGHTSVTNVLIQPQYVELRVELVRALRPFPEAREKVAAVLHALETRAAASIRSRELAGAAA